MHAHAGARIVTSVVTPSDSAPVDRASPRGRAVATLTADIARTWSRLSVATASSAGPHHRINEDSASPLDGVAPVYVVADGVGGGAMAAWASRHLVRAVHRKLERRRPDADLLVDALLAADREIAQGIAYRSGASGAATVAACAATGLLRARWLVAWVGDCRAYVLGRNGDPRLVTRDDTYANLGEAPPPGGSPDDPARMIGNGAVSRPNVAKVDLGWDEMLILASDGVHKFVDAAAIGRYLRDDAPLARRCRRIVEAARSNGSEDDATVLAVHRRIEPRARLARHGVALAAMLLAAAIAFVAAQWMSPAADAPPVSTEATR